MFSTAMTNLIAIIGIVSMVSAMMLTINDKQNHIHRGTQTDMIQEKAQEKRMHKIITDIFQNVQPMIV